MQLTAPLCCREAAGNIRSLNPPVRLGRHFSAHRGQFAVQLDGLGRMELNLQASAFNTQGINHLLHHVLQKLSEDPYGIFCLVLTPTRELAYQIAEQFRVLGKPLGLRDCIIVGGMGNYISAGSFPFCTFRNSNMINTARNSETQKIFPETLIMDEADRLLEQGCTDFTKDLEVILGILPAKRQTLLFSATLTDTLQELKSVAMNRPFFWESMSETRTVEELDQRYILTPEKVKDAYLVHLIQTFTDEHHDWSIIIFTNTCKNCQILTMMLREFNFPTISLHSMMKQKQRFANLAKFKASVYRILIATDVAARGLDIPTVQVVINHNTPGLPKIYIHRVGRTARAGRNGVSITLVTQYDIHLVHSIEEQTPRPHAAIFSTSLLTLHGHRSLPLTCSLGLSCHLSARLFVLSSSSTLLFLSLVIGLVSLSRRFHSVVLRM
eukprot:superscaffoldBa00000892_g7856